jgi:hypothetical protein
MPDTFLDSVEDRLMQFGGVSGAVGFEKLRRTLQQGTVPNAAKMLALAKAHGKYAPAVDVAIELGKSLYLANPENRKGFAEAGKELTKKPLLYQLGKAFLTPADSAAKYDAYKQELDKKAFEKYLEEEYPWSDEWQKKQNAEIAARRAKESGTATR